MKRYLKNILIFLGIFFLFFSFDIIYAIIFKLLNLNIKNISDNTEMILVLIKNIVLLFILFFIYNQELISKFKDFRNNFTKYFDDGIKYWLFGLFIMFLSNFIINNITSSIAENENSVQSLINSYPIIACFLTTICAPFIEELIFRKSLRNAINNKFIYIITSGLIFGYLHVLGSDNILEYLYIIPYGGLGATFAYLYVKTNNIYVPIMMHMIHNGLLTILAVIF